MVTFARDEKVCPERTRIDLAKFAFGQHLHKHTQTHTHTHTLTRGGGAAGAGGATLYQFRGYRNISFGEPASEPN